MGCFLSLTELNEFNQLTDRDELQERTFNSYLAKHLWKKFKDKRLQETDIVSACSTGQKHIIRLLIRHGTNVNQKVNGWTGLLEVCKPSNLTSYEVKMEIADMLIKHGADVNIANDYGWTPLLFTTKNTNFNLTFLLLRNGAYINVQNVVGYTPLMYACKNNDITVVKLLLTLANDIPDLTIRHPTSDKTIWDYVIRGSRCEDNLIEYSEIFINCIVKLSQKYNICKDVALIICEYLAYY